ncbi:nucleolar and coiled-body phosphoprotein 1-like [Dermacentor albipictus]|uniref:nucleolar and coiled-body phosphoprotein 1-like n=1 Tax=Dermacentor albipictus TaxID=60249 RepID=UPI0031FCED00
MSSSEGGGGGSSDEHPDESVEYSGAKADGVMYLVFGIISIVVIVVVVLLVVFLMNRSPANTAEPAMVSTTAWSKCTNPCMGAGKVCHPDSKKDADGCFVQDCHCYSPEAAHTCNNPCNATGQVCHFGSPLDEHGCYMPSCRCVTCKHECPMDKKCDPNTPAGPDGCPMAGCTCVPMMCPARCPPGKQCAPDAPTDMHGCFEVDCQCVAVSLGPTHPDGIPTSCPVLCPANFSCHKMQPLDASRCYVAPCPCVRDSCPNPCPGGEICDLNTPIGSDGCLISPCTCVPQSGHVQPSVMTPEPVEIPRTADSITPAHSNSSATGHVRRALEVDADIGEDNATDSKDGVPVLKRSPSMPENGNGSEGGHAQDSSDNATAPRSLPEPAHHPDALSTDDGTREDATKLTDPSGGDASSSPVAESTVQKSSSAQDEPVTSAGSAQPDTGSVSVADGDSPSEDAKLTGSGETAETNAESVTEPVTVGAVSMDDYVASPSSPGPENSEKRDATEVNGGEISSDVSMDTTASPDKDLVPEGETLTVPKEAVDDSTAEVNAKAAVDAQEAPVTSSEDSEKIEKAESPPPDGGEDTSKDSDEKATSSQESNGDEDAPSAKEAMVTDPSAAGETAGGAEPSTEMPSASAADVESGSRVRRSVDAGRVLVLEPPVISLGKTLVNGASSAINATRILAKALRSGGAYQEDTRSKHAPILIPSVGEPASTGLQYRVGKEVAAKANITRQHGL